MVYYISYVSTAVFPLSELKLMELLTQCRTKNKKNNITGMLLYIEGTFIQTLEGEKKYIDELYEKILIDSRHKDIFKLLSGFWKERRFENWSMGFRSTSNKEIQEEYGYSNISDSALLKANKKNENHPALKLLQSFYEQLPLHQKLTDRISDN